MRAWRLATRPVIANGAARRSVASSAGRIVRVARSPNTGFHSTIAVAISASCVAIDAPGGFDTHSNQASSLGDDIQTVCDALLAFQRDLEALGLADRVRNIGPRAVDRRANRRSHRQLAVDLAAEADLDGLPNIRSEAPAAAPVAHPIGAVAVDHVVALTPDFDARKGELAEQVSAIAERYPLYADLGAAAAV